MQSSKWSQQQRLANRKGMYQNNLQNHKEGKKNQAMEGQKLALENLGNRNQ